MKYDILLCDIDDTLFDFHKGEAIALENTFRAFDIPLNEETWAAYDAANREQWRKLERGETTSQKLRVDRFAEFLRAIGQERDADAMSDVMIDNLGQQRWPLPYCVELCGQVSQKMPIWLVTNGIARVQHSRMENCILTPYISGMVISEEMGVSKPNPKMVWEALAQAGVDDLSRAVFLGDSQTSDIAAANNAGVDSILFTNGKDIPADHKATYAVRTLEEACEIILAE